MDKSYREKNPEYYSQISYIKQKQIKKKKKRKEYYHLFALLLKFT